jgi:hypothetical protein
MHSSEPFFPIAPFPQNTTRHSPGNIAAVALIVLLSALASANANAQRLEFSDRDFRGAAAVVSMFDLYAAKCAQGRGFNAQESNQIDAWQNAHRVAPLRAALRDLKFSQRPRLEQSVAGTAEKVLALGTNPCDAAISTTKMSEAQFATNAPRLMTLLGGTTKTAGATATSAPSSLSVATSVVVPSSPPSSQAQSDVVKQIEGFGFDTGMTMGVGGFLTVNTHPILLFRNGDVLKNVEGLAFNGGIDAHKRAKPDQWTRWRRVGSELQLQKKEGWKAMYYQTVYSRLPDDFKLNGLFRSLSGAGNVAAGGNQSVAAWSDYRFAADGTVTRGGGAGGSGQSGDASVVTQSSAANRRGRYRIEEGLLLQITYDNGSSERRVLVTDPKDPKSAIWLDGVGYVRRDK